MPSAVTATLHPMDIMNVIFNCCDNILLQVLMEKLFLCRLSIPLVFPDPNKNKSIFLLWALRGIVPEFNSGSPHQEKLPLVDIKQYFFSFVRIGRLQISKSKLLNEILSSKHHTTFFHRDCQYGMSTRLDSNGTIEASWYLPCESESNGLNVMFTLLNLRGESTEFKMQSHWLCRVSDLVFVMLDLKVLSAENYKKFIMVNKVFKLQFVVCFVAGTVDQIDQHADSLNQCKQFFLNSSSEHIFDVLYNWTDNTDRLLSIEEIKTKARQIIRKYVETHDPVKSMATNLLVEAPEFNFRVDEHEPITKEIFGSLSCNSIFQDTIKLTDSIAELEPIKRKAEVLPLQGELWKQWGQLKREQYRKQLAPEESVEKFIAQKEREGLDIRRYQFDILRNYSSPILIEIGSKLEHTNQIFGNQFFINSLQLILNKWSKTVMPSLNKNYYKKLKENRQKWSMSLNDDEKNALIKENLKLGEEMICASFGIEHIFREFGQMYETTTSLKSHVVIPENLTRISNYPHVVARLILQGLPFEIMDGDTGFIPLTWFTAVMEGIHHIVGEKKLFIISVIGIQSSGKSTLLNTMFGLKLSVSAGRCTKGVYFVMIPVDKESMGVDYDYLVVIDTEGLRALETQEGGLIHDNELATLVIGMGDVTIVNIKGENSADLNDVLQIVIHAMIRMSLVNPNLVKPSCVFVHQNVPSIDEDDKLNIEQEKLLAKLDKITREAAEEEKVAHIERFQDVISYDEHKHVYYMPDLWQGQPPMAPVNCGYSVKVKQIKKMLTHNIASKSRLSTLTSFKNRISDLWTAILNEDFVFSFKNSEEVQAFTRLDRQFTKLYWNFKDLSLTLQVYCQSVVPSIEEKQNLHQLERKLEQQLTTELSNKCTQLQIDLAFYFDENEHCDILAKWREIYKTNLNNISYCEQNRIVRVLHENVNSRMKQLETNTNVKERITETALAAALYLRENKQGLNNMNLLEYFNEQWPKWLNSDSSDNCEKHPECDILTTLRHELHNFFLSHKKLLQSELKVNPLEELENCKFKSYTVNVHILDLEYTKSNKNRKISRYASAMVRYVPSAEYECTSVLKQIQGHVESCHGTDFHPGQVAQVMQILNNFFSDSDDKKYQNGFMLSIKFRIRFAVDVCKCSANEFIKNKLHFLEVNSPVAEVSRRKDDFFNLFKNTYQNVANIDVKNLFKVFYFFLKMWFFKVFYFC